MPTEKKETGLLSMLDKKDVTLELHRNWGQLYLSNAPTSLNTDKTVPYQSVAVFFGADQHNLDFLRDLLVAVEKAVRWVEANQSGF